MSRAGKGCWMLAGLGAGGWRPRILAPGHFAGLSPGDQVAPYGVPANRSICRTRSMRWYGDGVSRAVVTYSISHHIEHRTYHMRVGLSSHIKLFS